jgi:hypothetical protein
MRKVTAAFAAIAVLWSVTASAGVVLEQSETTTGGPAAGAGAPHTFTTMVEGNKEKMIMNGHGYVIIDLDKGVRTLVDTEDKTYSESPFPPSQAAGPMLKQYMAESFNFQPTGNKRTVVGYTCEESSNSFKTPNGESSTTACYSAGAPGAAEYAAFQKTAATKIRATLGEASSPSHGVIPDGVPLVTHSMHKVTNFAMPGLPPGEADRLRQMMANRPPMVSEITVTKISSQSLPADTFSVPAGYTKSARMRPQPPMAMRPGGPGAPPAGSGTSMVPSAP